MKIQLILTVLFSLCLFGIADVAAQDDKALPKGRLLYTDGSHDDVFVIKYKAGVVTYRTDMRSLNILQAKKPKLESVYFYEPKVFSEAMGLYRAKNYGEAKSKFAECELEYKPFDTIANNYATLAGFYKLECSRRSNDLEALSADLEKYRKDGLTRDSHFQQIEVYALWEAVRLKEWARLDRLALSWTERKVPFELRVQIEYCHALALDELAKEDPSRFEDLIDAYNRVLTADATASIDLVLKAANSLLRIYANDADVKFVMENWDPSADRASLPGDQKLMQAVSLMRYYRQVGFDDIEPLSAEYEKLFKYVPEETINVAKDEASSDEAAVESNDQVKDE